MALHHPLDEAERRNGLGGFVVDLRVISASYHRALTRGVKLAGIFETLKQARSDVPDAPIVTMVSYAIVNRTGVAHYLDEAVKAGVDGLIVPDLPVEESASLLNEANAKGLKLIQLVTPTTPRERAVRIAETTTGFLYYVSIAGITGERTELPRDLVENVGWLRGQTDLPICVGFGISRPEHVRKLSPVADGLIVGSALVRRLAESEGPDHSATVKAIADHVGELAEALKS